ncbi:hypothetical protein Agabi119p4_5723 [Agaricus bisporus var. burnettii]|uniref:Uncharacterized protein n=1 Tax=Agaricus bisporus var. burnettii TaxID=192524 RepID=A0A8H7F2E0_AGABI|nr:hypothetical protein Agabi119p4_5723 [Agaricus bisporus var. burnettii]
MNVYFTSANIPHRVRAQEYFIHFASTSQSVNALEQLTPFLRSLGAKWHEAFDCQLHDEIIFQAYAHLHSGDNPMQAALASHPGVIARFACRGDMTGGTSKERETDEGYHALYQLPLDKVREPEKTVNIIKGQLEIAAMGVQSRVTALGTENGVKDMIAELWIPQLIQKAQEEQHSRIENEATRDSRFNMKLSQKQAREMKIKIKNEIQQDLIQWLIKQPEDRYQMLPASSEDRLQLRAGDHYNPLFGHPGLDPHADTPCEILHTILLGVDKYLWADTTVLSKWPAWKDAQFAARLESLSINGLSLHSFRPRYMLQYKNSLIGRQLKAIQQLGVFCLANDTDTPGFGVSRGIFDLWKYNGELGALLWVPEISDMKTYLEDIRIATNNLLDAWGKYDPARIQYKLKLHLLAHLARDIERFGPAILYSTESFEGWNSVFRTCSILSNHHSPSRDIADTLAGMECFKHVVSGGWWKGTSEHAKYVRAGKGIIQCFTEDSQLRRRLGLTDSVNYHPGSITTSNSESVVFDEKIPTSLHEKDLIDCSSVVSHAGDVCRPLSWVFYDIYSSDSVRQRLVGRISNILMEYSHLSSDEGCLGFAIMTRFLVATSRHSQLSMPVLRSTGIFDIVPTNSIQFIFNAQCCPGVEGQFVVNTHALHNAHLVRRELPQLTRPIPKYDERQRVKEHGRWAEELRVSGPAKRAATTVKANATRQKNKDEADQRSAKEAQATAATMSGLDLPGPSHLTVT